MGAETFSKPPGSPRLCYKRALLVFLSWVRLPRAMRLGLERKLLHPVHWIQSHGEGKTSSPCPWSSSDPAAELQTTTRPCLSLVPSLLITTRWHCRLKWNTANLLAAPRWGSGLPHLGIKRTRIPICSFYRWWHWGSETRHNLPREAQRRTSWTLEMMTYFPHNNLPSTNQAGKYITHC